MVWLLGYCGAWTSSADLGESSAEAGSSCIALPWCCLRWILMQSWRQPTVLPGSKSPMHWPGKPTGRLASDTTEGGFTVPPEVGAEPISEVQGITNTSADSRSTSLLQRGQHLSFIYNSVEPATQHSNRNETINHGHQTWKTISQQQPTAKSRLGTKQRHQHHKSAMLQQGTQGISTTITRTATPLPPPQQYNCDQQYSSKLQGTNSCLQHHTPLIVQLAPKKQIRKVSATPAASGHYPITAFSA
ncbi:hypothetical protein Nepgr_033562 [Nepenthes gracilis]|uniref:Uncharacterized protein n=1 Tax=Nepenthes gracilis TaxID=150966 RepID=A0AAD3TMJ3_NEPGR|nr:hypothetical protein Nepgr_033562 [Nepenthes gracilis]